MNTDVICSLAAQFLDYLESDEDLQIPHVMARIRDLLDMKLDYVSPTNPETDTSAMSSHSVKDGQEGKGEEERAPTPSQRQVSEANETMSCELTLRDTDNCEYVIRRYDIREEASRLEVPYDWKRRTTYYGKRGRRKWLSQQNQPYAS